MDDRSSLDCHELQQRGTAPATVRRCTSLQHWYGKWHLALSRAVLVRLAQLL
jgi:hypothetical protein